MKRLAVLLMLVVLVLASGCSYYRAKKAEKEGLEQLEKVQAQAEQMQEQMAASQKAMQQVSTPQRTVGNVDTEDEYDATASPEVIRVGGEDGAGLTKLGTQYRDKTGSEHCDIDYPFACMSYIASGGRVDITLKYQAYQGMLKEVSLYLDGDECDPSGTQIEPGQKQKFSCYADEEGSQLAGNLEIEYFETLKKATLSKTGSIVANWE